MRQRVRLKDFHYTQNQLKSSRNNMLTPAAITSTHDTIAKS